MEVDALLLYVVCPIVLRLPTVEAGNVPGLQALQDATSDGSHRQQHLHELASAQHPPQSNAEVHFLLFVTSHFFHWNINTGETVQEEMCDPEQK